MLRATTKSEQNMPGSALNIMNLLPNLSIMKTAIVDPIAFIKANGIFIMIPSLFKSVIPGTVIPDCIII